MSGITGQDGYDFQGVASVCLTIEKIKDRRKIKKVYLEVRKLNSTNRRIQEFVVDLVIESEPLDGSQTEVEITEIKGGNLTPEDLPSIQENIRRCKDELYPGVGSTIVFTEQLVVRLQPSEGVFAKASELGLSIVELSDKIDSGESVSSLEQRCMNSIESLLKRCLPPDFPSNLKLTVLFSLEHLFHHEIKRLAQKLRDEGTINFEKVDISFEMIMNHEGSFSDTIAIQNKTPSTQGYDHFCEFVFKPGVTQSPTQLLDPAVFPSAPPPEDDDNNETEGQNG